MTLITNTSKFCARIPDLNLIYSFLTQDEKLIFSKVCKLFHEFAKAEEQKVIFKILSSGEKHALFLCYGGEILILDLLTYATNFTATEEYLKYGTTLHADLIPDGETSAAFNIGVKLYNIRKELETQQNSPETAMEKIATLPASILQIVSTKLDKIRRANIDFSKVNPIAIPEIFETPPSSQEIIQAIDQTIEHFKLAASLQKIDETRPHKSRKEGTK